MLLHKFILDSNIEENSSSAAYGESRVVFTKIQSACEEEGEDLYESVQDEPNSTLLSNKEIENLVESGEISLSQILNGSDVREGLTHMISQLNYRRPTRNITRNG